jgi:tetratricopeptide (TPR) repeat protein
MKLVEAAIVIADIEESSGHANYARIETYNRMVREYHQLAYEIVHHYQDENKLGSINLECGARGDEVVFIVHSLPRKENALHALKLGLLFQEAWRKSNYNRMRVEEESKDFAHARIGIGEGVVALDKNPWANKETVEGFPICQTKRIEGKAGEKWVPTKILIKSSLRPIIEQSMPSLGLGQDHPLKLEGVGEVVVFPVDKYEGWLEEIKQVKQKREKDVHFLFQTVFSALMAGDSKLAETTSQELINLQPKNAVAYLYYGISLALQGKNKESMEEYKKSIRINPVLAEAHVNLGVEYYKFNDFVEAEKEFRRVIELRPDDAGSYNNLGLALASQGKHAEAIPQFQEALRLSFDYLDPYLNLANSLFNIKKLREALDIYKDALSHVPEDRKEDIRKLIVRISSDYANIFIYQGNFEEARRILIDVFNFATSDEQRAELKKQLKEIDKPLSNPD